MAIGATQESGKQVNSIIDAIYEGYIILLVVAWSLVMPHVRLVCVILYLVMPHVRHAHLGLHIWLNLRGRTTCIWSFGYGFVCATTM